MADLCDRFVADYLPRKRPSTQDSYRQQIETEIRPALGKLKVAEVVFADVDRLHRAISKRAPYRANRVHRLALADVQPVDPLAHAHRQPVQGHREAIRNTNGAAICRPKSLVA